MLIHIQIRDFAIIDAIELELDRGMTVLTGETGAGKSILVDALLLAAGGRAGAEVVRHGAERAEVSATFAVRNNSGALAWLSEQAIEHEGECTLRRVVSSDGRSRAYVNGQSMPLQTVRQLGELLVEVHGQMEYQSLIRRTAQRDLLDRTGGHLELLAEVKSLWSTLASLREEHARAASSIAERTARMELLQYYLGELHALDLKVGEVEALTAERMRLSQRGKLAHSAAQIGQLLRDADDVSAEQALARALSLARGMTDLDPSAAQASRLIEESLIALREGIDAIERYEASLEADPQRQEWIEQRLAAIETVARKHRVEPAALLTLKEELSSERSRLEGLEASIDALVKSLRKREQQYADACRRLTAARCQAAQELSANVSKLMQTLGMPGGVFRAGVQPSDAPGASGADEVEFLVSANPGQPPRALSKVASGGELSRISLAIQVSAALGESLPCLVFDEVDAGVGGGVAEIVGRQLRTLANQAQVLCVTHLPQVASQAHAHVRVAKLTDGKVTRTTLHRLNADERIEEIARMLGGVDVTAKAREHAAEMLSGSSAAARKRGAGKSR